LVLLEKAYAKFHVNYVNLDLGYGDESMRELSGMPTLTFNGQTMSDSVLIQTLHDYDLKHWTMTATSSAGYYGLIGGHLYTVHGVVLLKNHGRVV